MQEWLPRAAEDTSLDQSLRRMAQLMRSRRLDGKYLLWGTIWAGGSGTGLAQTTGVTTAMINRVASDAYEDVRRATTPGNHAQGYQQFKQRLEQLRPTILRGFQMFHDVCDPSEGGDIRVSAAAVRTLHGWFGGRQRNHRSLYHILGITQCRTTVSRSMCPAS